MKIVRLSVGYAFVKIENYHELRGHYNFLRKVFTCRGMEYNPKSGRMVPVILENFLDRETHMFGFGLLSKLLEALNKRKLAVSVKDNRLPPHIGQIFYPLTDDRVTLRDDQEAGVQAFLKTGHGVWDAATNAGKTEMAVEVIRRLGLKTLFVVKSRDLLDQSKEKIEKRLKTEVGIMASPEFDTSKDVTVCMAQSLSTRLNDFKDFLKTIDLLILDECHNITDNRVYAVVRACPAYYRLAMSGTPYGRGTLNKWRLNAFFGPRLAKISNIELIHKKVSADLTINLIPCTTYISPKLHYNKHYVRGVVLNKKRNWFIARLAKKLAPGVLILVLRHDHAYQLHEMLSELGLVENKDFAFLLGTDNSIRRHQVLGEFKSGKLPILIGSSILDEGIDTDAIRTLVMAGGTKAPVGILQRIGRALRRSSKKQEVLVIDFLDKGSKHMWRHSKKRMTLYKKEGFIVKQLRQGI